MPSVMMILVVEISENRSVAFYKSVEREKAPQKGEAFILPSALTRTVRVDIVLWPPHVESVQAIGTYPSDSWSDFTRIEFWLLGAGWVKDPDDLRKALPIPAKDSE